MEYGGTGPPLVPDSHDDIELITLNRSGSFEKRLTVKAGQQKLKHEVYVNNADVSFEVSLVSDSNQVTPLVPPEKIPVSKETGRGVIRRVLDIPSQTKEILFKYRNHAALVQKNLVFITTWE